MPDKRAARLDWTGEGLRFRGGGTDPNTPEIELDGSNEKGPSPMLALLLAAAGCTGADVVVMLEKMRVGLENLSIEVEGIRRDEHPKRYRSIALHFSMSGAALDRSKVERAVRLSLDKYCSVLHSLDPAIDVVHTIAFT